MDQQTETIDEAPMCYTEQYTILFGNYENMGDAFRVASQYIPQITAKGLEADAVSIIRNSDTPEILGDRLFYLTQTGFTPEDSEKLVSRAEKKELILSWFELAHRDQEDCGQ